MMFGAPLWLLLAPLALLPWLAWGRSRTPHTRTRLGLVLALSTLSVAAVVVALARPFWVARVPTTRIAIATDPRDQQQIEAWREQTPYADPFFVVRAGAQPVLGARGATAIPDAEGPPDLARALRLADALGGDAAEVLLCTDGSVQGLDPAAQSAVWSRAQRRLHVRRHGAAPALRCDVTHAASVAAGDALAVALAVHSDAATQGALRVREAGQLLLDTSLALPAGSSAHRFDVVPGSDRGTATIELELTAGAQQVSLRTAVEIGPPLRVHRLGSENSAPLRAMLAEAQIELVDLEPQALADPRVLTGADAVLLDDLPAERLDAATQQALAEAVTGLGTGLVVAGSSTSLSSYVDTPLAGILPVELEPREERRDPSVALVIILDTSGSMGGTRIELAKEVARLAVRRLLPHDKVGIVEFYGSRRWAAPLQPASNLIEITRALNRLQAGGGTIIYSAIEEAYYAMLNARTRFKHILVLTDGGVENAPFEPLARRIADSGVQLHTVLIGPQANSPFLVNLAQWGRGRFYACPSRFQLPELRFKEPQSAPLSSQLDQAAEIRRTAWHAVTEALGDQALPAPHGLVAARTRAGASTLLQSGEAPYLATWDQGLGRVATFCSELLGPADEGLRTDRAHGAVIASILRQVARARAAARPQLELRADPAALRVRVTGVPPPVWPAPRIVQAGTLATPVLLLPQEPGCYEAWLELPAREPLAVEVELADGTRLRGAAIAPSGPRADDAWPGLSALAELSGGTTQGALPADGLAGVGPAVEVTRWFVLLALLAFVLGLVVRRLPGRVAMLLVLAVGGEQVVAQQDPIAVEIQAQLAAHGDPERLLQDTQAAPLATRIEAARAVGRLELALSLTQDEPQWLRLRAELLEALGHPEEAIAAWTALLAQQGLDDAARAHALVRRAQLRDPKRAGGVQEADLRAAGELADDETRQALGHLAGQLGHYQLALAWHRVEGATPGKEFLAAMRRARWQEAAHELPAADQSLADAVALARTARDRRFALAERAGLARRQQRLPELAAEWLQQRDAGPEQLEALLELLRELGRADEALALVARDPQARPELAFAIALEAGAGERAVAVGRAQLARKPADAQLRAALALLLTDLDRRDEAVALLIDGIRTAERRRDIEQLVRASLDLGLVPPVAAGIAQLRASGDPEDAIEALILDVQARQRQQGREAALAALDAARDGFTTPAHQVRIGEIYEQLERPAEAIAQYRAALAGSNAEDLALRLGWLLSRSREPAEREEALTLFRRVWLGAGSAARRAQVEDQVLDLAAREGTLADLAIELEAALQDPETTDREAKRDALIKIYTRAKDSLGAVQVLRELAREPGREIEAWERIARVHLQNEEFRAHERALRRLIELDPEHELDWRQQLAMSALERGRPAEARAVIEEMVARPDADEIAFEFAAGIYTLAGRHADAARVYRQTLARHPQRIETLLLLGGALQRLGRHDEASGIFLDQILRPVADDLLLVAADGLLNVGAPAPALRCAVHALRRRLAAAPDRVHLGRMLQDLLETLGEREARAQALHATVLVAGEQRAPFVRELMDEARSEKRWQDYVRHGRLLLALGDEMPPSVFVDLGEAFVQLGELGSAERAFERARLATDFAAIERRVAEVYDKAGRPQDAARIWRRILRRDERDAKALLALAQLEELLGQPDAALAHYQSAAMLELDQLSSPAASSSARRLPQPAAAEGPGAALDGLLRCASRSTQMAELLAALRPRMQADEAARAAAALELFGRIARALAEPELRAELAAIEQRLLAGGPAPEVATVIAQNRIASGDVEGALAALPETAQHHALRFSLAVWQGDFARALQIAASEPPQSWGARIRELLLTGASAQANQLGDELQARAAAEPDRFGAAWIEAGKQLGRQVDEQQVREQRLAKALAEPAARRISVTLAALRADPGLPAERKAQVLRSLLPLARSDSDANQAWAYVTQARHHLPAEELTDLIEKCLTGLPNPTLVFGRLDLLSLLPPDRQQSIVTAIVGAAEAAERDQLRLRILTSGVELEPALTAALIEPLDLRNPSPYERSMFRMLCIDSELSPAAVAALRGKVAASELPVLPALFAARTSEGEERARAVRRLVREYTARLELDASDLQLLDRLLPMLPPDVEIWPELANARTATARALRLRVRERQGEFAAALHDANDLFRAQPDQRFLLDELLRLLAAAGDREAQVEAWRLHFERAANLYPYQTNEFAELLLELGRPAEALAALDRVEDPYGYGLANRLRAITQLEDPQQRLQLGRAWVQQRQAQARSRRAIFVTLPRRVRGGPELAETLRIPRVAPGGDAGPTDPIEWLARMPEGVELARACLRPLADAERDAQPALYRAWIGAARKAGTLEPLLAQLRSLLAERPFDAEALRAMFAAAELGEPVAPELIEREIERRLLLGPTNRQFEVEAFFLSERLALAELRERLLARLTSARSLLMDGRLLELLPALLQRIGAVAPERLLELLPGDDGASVTLDSELLAAILATPGLRDRHGEIAARCGAITQYLRQPQTRATRDRLALPWFGFCVARGDDEGMQLAMESLQAPGSGYATTLPHLIGAGMPPLAVWSDAGRWRAVGDRLLQAAADPGPRDHACQLAILLAVRLHEAGRTAEARTWLAQVAPLVEHDPRLRRWVAQALPPPARVRVATFNASLFRDQEGGLAAALAGGADAQARAVAAIVQRVRPDVLLLQEFDYEPAQDALRLFEQEYLARSQQDSEPIEYPFVYSAPVNTGVPTGLDLDRDGRNDGPGDAAGYGRFPGQYGMVVLSRFPLLLEQARTFRELRWEAMPDSMLPRDWYDAAACARLPLSSKSHWDLPVRVGATTLHLLCSHPTPPVFDGPEDRNGRRNHDEIRFWTDYLTPARAEWIQDDQGRRGGLSEQAPFVVLGDLNCDPNDGDSTGQPVRRLLEHARVQPIAPASEGGAQAARAGGKNAEHRGDPAHDTCVIDAERVGNLRLDYVLPSAGLRVHSHGVFWPVAEDPLHARLLGADRRLSSDHRLVWVELEID